jgi:hypothetical protein
VPGKTAAFLVLILVGATIQPLACAVWCATEQAIHESCHEQSGTGTQLLGRSNCDIDALNSTAMLTKTRSVERSVFVPVPSRQAVRDVLERATSITSLPPGLPLRAALHRPTILRI